MTGRSVTQSFAGTAGTTFNVEGGAPYNVNDAAETHIDIQHSGGMAPKANIILFNLPDLDVGAVREEGGVRGAHQQVDLGARVGGGEQMDDVIAERAGCAGDENLRGVGTVHVESSLS